MSKTALEEFSEWLKAFEYELPLELQVKSKEALEKEKEQIIDAYIEGYTSWDSEMTSLEYYTKTYKKKE